MSDSCTGAAPLRPKRQPLGPKRRPLRPKRQPLGPERRPLGPGQTPPGCHHRRSIRLKGYDYTRAGAYFVTIVTQDRACLFGEVVEGQMQLNEYGRIVLQEWFRTAELRPYVLLFDDEFVVMPNHVHGIIWIVDDGLDDGDGDTGGAGAAGDVGGVGAVGVGDDVGDVGDVGGRRGAAPLRPYINYPDPINYPDHVNYPAIHHPAVRRFRASHHPRH